jgi:hypothetical protein
MCVARTRIWLHAVSAAALALTALGADHCRRVRRHPEGPRSGVRRATAELGVWLALTFALLILGTDLPGWLLDPCE